MAVPVFFTVVEAVAQLRIDGPARHEPYLWLAGHVRTSF